MSIGAFDLETTGSGDREMAFHNDGISKLSMVVGKFSLILDLYREGGRSANISFWSPSSSVYILRALLDKAFEILSTICGGCLSTKAKS